MKINDFDYRKNREKSRDSEGTDEEHGHEDPVSIGRLNRQRVLADANSGLSHFCSGESLDVLSSLVDGLSYAFDLKRIEIYLNPRYFCDYLE